MKMKSALLFVIAAVSVVVGQERWYPFRFEYCNSGRNELGLSSGVWWSLHEDGIPLDAYGPIVAVKGIFEGNRVLPCVLMGFEANALFLCARMQGGVRRTADNALVTLVNPQVGITWISLVNLYVGYSKKIAGPAQANANEVNLSFCINLPSYFFRDMD